MPSLTRLAGIYGLEADQGFPTKITPLSPAGLDTTLQRLEHLCADGIEPWIVGLHFQLVMVAGGYVLVIRVPRSWISPHRVSLKSHGHFYGRSAIGTSST